MRGRVGAAGHLVRRKPQRYRGYREDLQRRQAARRARYAVRSTLTYWVNATKATKH